LFKNWEENESNKLKRLEKDFKSLKFEYEMLRLEFRNIQKKVAEKEVTHIQKVQVEVKKQSDFDWDIGY
jgi:archaellum component FlaC